jgi:hypothetical protein
MDWFEKLTGFRETSYDDTRAKLKVEGRRLHSPITDRAMPLEDSILFRYKPCARG